MQKERRPTSFSVPRRLSSVKEAVWLFLPIFRGSTRLLESQLTEPPCRWSSHQPWVQGISLSHSDTVCKCILSLASLTWDRSYNSGKSRRHSLACSRWWHTAAGFHLSLSSAEQWLGTGGWWGNCQSKPSMKRRLLLYIFRPIKWEIRRRYFILWVSAPWP